MCQASQGRFLSPLWVMMGDVAIHSAPLYHCAHHAQSQTSDTVLNYMTCERYW